MLIKSITIKIFSLSRPAKRIIQILSDCALIALCFWIAMALSLNGIFTEIKPKSWLTLAAVIPPTVLIFVRLGLYRAVVRYMAEQAVFVIILGSALSSAIMFTTSQYFALEVPRSVPGIYFPLLVLAAGGTRLIMRTMYSISEDSDRKPVVIYGAGEAGRLLVRSLQDSKNYRAAALIDDEKRLQGSSIAGTPVLPLEKAREKISTEGVKTALIAIGNENLKSQKLAAATMAGLGLEVRMIPNTSDLVSGRVRISSLRRLKIEELLHRDIVEADPRLMNATTRGKSIMITGAGGSIGSELCRQILLQAPRRLVLFEMSEYALYKISEELKATIKAQKYDVELVLELGSVTRPEAIENAIRQNAVETIFHAAAYKHVPLVEQNAVEAVINNVFGTYLTAQAAGRFGVKYFALISTDKAVRPTNIMGATKRLAELTVLDASKAHPSTNFCSVRFGNVLGSSGSIVPKFEQQIRDGGPLTITHPEVTRYFMTIPEAAQLVIQASAMAEKGKIFLLDMGEPVRILDLAAKMCSLHGKQLHSDETKEAPDGAIKIEITGLRPGEKLYEELLVAGTEVKTEHPKIKCEEYVCNKGINIKTTIDHLLGLRNNAEVAEALTNLPLEYSIDCIHQPQYTRSG